VLESAPEALCSVRLLLAGIVAPGGSEIGVVPTMSVQPLRLSCWLPALSSVTLVSAGVTVALAISTVGAVAAGAVVLLSEDAVGAADVLAPSDEDVGAADVLPLREEAVGAAELLLLRDAEVGAAEVLPLPLLLVPLSEEDVGAAAVIPLTDGDVGPAAGELGLGALEHATRARSVVAQPRITMTRCISPPTGPTVFAVVAAAD